MADLSQDGVFITEQAGTAKSAWKWPLFALFLLLAGCMIVCGTVGFAIADPEDDLSMVVYKVAQLFVLNSGTQEPPNVLLIVARCAAVVLFSIGAIKIVLIVFREAWDRFRLRFLFWNRHAVICGLGRIGIGLCRSLRRAGWEVVVIEKNESNPNIGAARDLRAVVLIGDATDKDKLVTARVHRSSFVFAVAGEDVENVEVAAEVWKLLPAPSASTGPPSGKGPNPPSEKRPAKSPRPPFCYTHIADPVRTDILHRAPMFTRPNPGLAVKPLNMFHLSSLHFMEKYAARHRPGIDQVAYFVVVGFGQMGQTLALTAARLAHFENCKRLRMTILDEEIERKCRRFIDRYPGFCPDPAILAKRGARSSPLYLDLGRIAPAADLWSSRIYRPRRAVASPDRAVEYACNAEFVSIPGEVDSADVRDALERRLSGEGVCPAIIVCFDDAMRNFETALSLRARLRPLLDRVPIYVWLPYQAALAQVIAAEEKGRKAGASDLEGIFPFGDCRTISSFDQVTRHYIEHFAESIHIAYQSAYPGMKSWSELGEAYRFSNYLAAEHLRTKLLAVGCDIVQASAVPDELLVATIEGRARTVLAEIEHNRWLAEKLVDGWRYGQPTSREERERLRINDSIVPWDRLEGEGQNKDLAQIDAIAEIVRDTPRTWSDGAAGGYRVGAVGFRDVCVSVIVRRTARGREFLLTFHPDYGYFFPAALRPSGAPVEQEACEAVRGETSYQGPFQATSLCQVRDRHLSARYGNRISQYLFHVCRVEVPGCDLGVPGNPLEVALNRHSAELVADGAVFGPCGYWNWFTEEELKADPSVSETVAAMLPVVLERTKDVLENTP